MIRFLAFFLVFFQLFSSCDASGTLNREMGSVLGLKLSGGTVLANWDSHGGFHGDGTKFAAIQFPDDSVADQIRNTEDGRWKAFPIQEEEVRVILYGVTKRQPDGTDATFGPILYDHDTGEPLFPQVEEGYYFFWDRHSDTKTPLLERPSYNFTVAVYDAEKKILYYGKLDT